MVDSPALIHCVRFNLGDLVCAIDASQVQEVLRKLETTPVPGAPDFVTGIVSFRGAMLEVMDLGLRLGLGRAQASEQSRIIVTRADDDNVGLLVDDVLDVLPVDPARLQQGATLGVPAAAVDYIQSRIIGQEQEMNLLDLHRLIDDSVAMHERKPARGGDL
jgi:purine-binding chemotaxis protein CheW